MAENLPTFLHPASLLSSVNTRSKDCIDALFTHSERLNSALSHALWWPCRTVSGTPEAPSKVMLFVPGNPGLLGFYTTYLQSTYENLTQPDVAILAHGLLGHTPGLEMPEHLLGLRAQIDAILELIHALVSTFGNRTEILLVGHSVGAWLCLQSMKECPSNISGIFMLFPTLAHLKRTPNGQRLFWMFRRPIRDLVAKLTFITNVIPTQAILRRLYSEWPQEQIEVLHSFVASPAAVLACLTMADDEMMTILDLDIATFDEHRQKFWLFFADKDDWVADNKQTILQCVGEDLQDVRVVHGTYGIPHAFSICHSNELAEQTTMWMKKLMHHTTD